MEVAVRAVSLGYSIEEVRVQEGGGRMTVTGAAQ
jgi:uncharacterized protein YodC (DUF2158 family)